MSGRVLVVDDEMGIRELLSEILGDEGYEVIQAENADIAQAVRASIQPDLVLLDIWMPNRDGISLLKHWADTAQLTMPVVMMSGHGTIDTAVEATRMGAVGFLEKPIALKKLLMTVESVIKQHANMHTSEPVTPVTQLVSANDTSLAAHANLPLREARDQFERLYFERLIAQTDGNITHIAELAAVERTHLYRKLKQLGIKLPKK
jgi:DNA-binding NtrC family response regulator